MRAKLQPIENNGSWSLTALHIGKHTVGCKWVFKLKFRADGTLERHLSCCQGIYIVRGGGGGGWGGGGGGGGGGGRGAGITLTLILLKKN